MKITTENHCYSIALSDEDIAILNEGQCDYFFPPSVGLRLFYLPLKQVCFVGDDYTTRIIEQLNHKKEHIFTAEDADLFDYLSGLYA